MANQNKIFKSAGSFLGRQLLQIREEGLGIILHKAGKLFKLLSLRLFAPLAVSFKMDWPSAYHFIGSWYSRRYKELLGQYSGKKDFLKKIAAMENKAIISFERYVARKPELSEISSWVNAHMALFSMSLQSNGRYKKGAYQKIADTVHEIIKNHQLDQLDIEFIPRGIPIGSIGIYENLDTYIKAGSLGLRPGKKLIVLLDPKSKVNNPAYLSYWSRYVTIISDPFLIQALSPLERSLTVPIAFYMPFSEKALSSPFALGMVRKKWDMEKRRPLLTISDEHYQRGWDSLKSFGVPQGAWFVCLHVREAGWNDDNYSGKFRNADIKTFSSAIQAVVDAGGWVIRMGDPGMMPLPKMDQVIDYAHSKMKSDWMDIFLCSQCRFVIGTSSGVYTIPSIFGVPAVLTNLMPSAVMYQLSSRDIFIPRICRRSGDNRLLSFAELIAPPFAEAFTQHQYDSMGIEVIENTPEELKDVTLEMLARFEDTLKYSEKEEYFQEQFNSLAANCGEMYGDKDIALNARIGRDFLRKYASLLPSQNIGKALR